MHLQELFLAVAGVYASSSRVLKGIAGSLVLGTQEALHKGLVRCPLKGRGCIEPHGDLVVVQLYNSSIVSIYRLPFHFLCTSLSLGLLFAEGSRRIAADSKGPLRAGRLDAILPSRF